MSIAIVELVATPGGEEDNLCQNNQDFKVYYSNLLLLNGLVLTIDIKRIGLSTFPPGYCKHEIFAYLQGCVLNNFFRIIFKITLGHF